ncbi:MULTISPECIES: hypothetical protein [unclassified Sphingomonas]|uniref:hypothetical protein n=1 Tax=unclassified Sphingomonas TaxID=196159 RepID=UPI00082C4E9A|nr:MULTISPECIES: hypothetical protein [unclassified Sphingomonas]
MSPRILLLATALLPGACMSGGTGSGALSGGGGGVRGETAFRATGHASVFQSAHAPEAVAQCFRDHAQLPPHALVAPDPIDGAPLYRLRYQDYWFEQIAFRRSADGGTRIEILSSAAYDAAWTGRFVRDRLEPLGRCMGRDTDQAGTQLAVRR